MSVEKKPCTTSNKVEKEPYTTPELTVHGDVEAITQQNRVGTRLDATFQSGTPISDLTVS